MSLAQQRFYSCLWYLVLLVFYYHDVWMGMLQLWLYRPLPYLYQGNLFLGYGPLYNNLY